MQPVIDSWALPVIGRAGVCAGIPYHDSLMAYYIHFKQREEEELCLLALLMSVVHLWFLGT